MANQDWKHGLTTAQVRARVLSGRANTAVRPPSKTVWQIVAGNVFTYFNFVFLLLAVLLALVRSWRDLTFLPLIISNTLIGIVQELRAKYALDKLTMLNAPTALVVRNGKTKRIDAERLVIDDIVIFEAGNQIPADAEVIHGEVAANESLLTGEPDEIQKKPGAELMSGSFVVSGKCYARLTRVGADSYISQLTLQAKTRKIKEQSQIIRSLNMIVTIAGFAIIPVGIILFCQSHFGHNAPIDQSVRSMVASVLGMIPEGLFLLASVSLALSSLRLARKKVLLHEMKSIETLARVNILCVDKTGTITTNEMNVMDFLPLSTAKVKKEELFGLIADFAYAQDSDNITMTAVKTFFTKPSGREAVSVSAFSSEFKYSGTNFDGESYILGAPEFVLGDDFDKYHNEIEHHARKGYRVVVFGRCKEKLDGKKLAQKVEALGIVLLTNPIRDNAIQTFKYFADQGVDIKVISGDNPITVSEVAKMAKIKNAEHYVDASTLETDDAIARAATKYTVFGRVTPEQKRKLIQSMQAAGNTVAMTGDGVNDVLALRDADCSIAMASGSDAAAQAAQLVLLESDFSCMPSVVAEGRQVVNNLERSGSLFLVKNIFSILTSILAICLSVTYPLVPAQISLISMFTIGVPAFLLSQTPNKRLIKGNFVENILRIAVPGGIVDAFIVALTLVIGDFFGVSTQDIATAATFQIAVVGFVIIYRISKPLDAYKWLILIGCILGLTVSYIFVPTFFAMTRMHWKGIILCISLAALSVPIIKYVDMLVNWVWDIIKSNHMAKRHN